MRAHLRHWMDTHLGTARATEETAIRRAFNTLVAKAYPTEEEIREAQQLLRDLERYYEAEHDATHRHNP